MSFTMKVLAAVPSVTQSSKPVVPLLAAKSTLPLPTEANSEGFEPASPGLMSCSRDVPAAVPSVTQSSGTMRAVVDLKHRRAVAK